MVRVVDAVLVDPEIAKTELLHSYNGVLDDIRKPIRECSAVRRGIPTRIRSSNIAQGDVVDRW